MVTVGFLGMYLRPIFLLVPMLVSVTACGDKKPTEDEAFLLAKKEMSMALCGDKSADCFFVEGGNARVSDKKSDGTYSASATFSSMNGKGHDIEYSTGTVFFDIDAKTNDVYVKSIEAWSQDGSRSVKLCGREYKFCRK